MKRLAPFPLLALAGLLALTACAPPAAVANNVVPTLISIQLPEDPAAQIILVGRYFGDGEGGTAEDSYLIVGARSDCTGGVRMKADSWTNDRIAFRDPGGVGSGFVCVVAAGSTSNPLPANLN